MSKDGRFSQEPRPTAVTTLEVPTGACDSHGHIFPPRDLFPTASEAMPLAPVELYLDLRAQLGFDRGVLVQGGAYRHDNRAMLEALDRHPESLRGVALVPADATEADLGALAARNVRALRFTRGGASRIDDLAGLSPLMRATGLHAETFIGLDNLVERAPELLGHGVRLVLDHLAGPFDAALGVDQPPFQALLRLLGDHDLWVKLTPQRNSKAFPGYADARPFEEALVSACPDRLVWGSDWPFPHMGDQTPDLGALVTLFGEWVTDPSLRRAILVDNPARLYGF